VWVMDVDPTWSPLVSSAVPSDLVDKVQGYVMNKPTSKERRQLKTSEFLKTLERE